MTQTQPLILASSSPYRRALLDRLTIPFETLSPDIDESSLPGESAEQLVRRLSLDKAREAAGRAMNATIIASDQVAVLQDEVLTKPGSHERAVHQLQRMRGQTVSFHTGLCVLNGVSDDIQLDIVTCDVAFRAYSEEEIERYLQLEKPYNCAGSFKSEALGISLIRKMEGPDPTALIGLPLIRLAEMLRSIGYNLP